ncbi:MAG: MBL fold metallo-hydrolase [Candidatus Humimicrobiaceae bacterium]
MSLVDKIKEVIIPEGSIGIWWLGQAGFIIKMSSGEVIIIDVYLSDCCERIHGFKRITQSPLKAEELEGSLVIVTHAHYDHFDIDSVPIFMDKPDIKLAGPESVINESLKLGINRAKLILLQEGKEIGFKKFKLLPVYSDHGNLAPDALGFILDFNYFKLYFTGDTAYRPEKMKLAIQNKPEIIILPINGKFDNLTPVQAAKLAKDVKAKVSIPCHFWTFIEHNGNPLAFSKALKKYAPGCESKILSIGEGFIYP